ncbi:hypothetical protein HJC23_007016 [Cyclotella cryptica]|uniref:Uncharacterized protein n=1 Tax=Cyclotella cryptica TaxID=29204 RepID=A0ABD3QNC0_9STRA
MIMKTFTSLEHAIDESSGDNAKNANIFTSSSLAKPSPSIALKQQQSFQRKTQRQSLSGLSRAHQSLLAKTSHMRRQRFVTGKYPLYVEVKQNPTKKWLGLAESMIYLNGTSIEKSLASYEIFHWLTDAERQELHGDYEFLSLELLAEIHVKKPGYVNILPKNGAGKGLSSHENEFADGGMFGWKSWKSRLNDEFRGNSDELSFLDDNGERLWITGFSLTKPRGELHTVDVETGVMSHVNDRTARAIKWPNEVASIPRQAYNYSNNVNITGINGHRDTTLPHPKEDFEDALLVTDGFLVPGKDKGGLYVVRNPGNAVSEWRVCLTGVTNLQDVFINGEGDWFYHRAIWIDLTGDGRQSILAARAKLPSILNGNDRSQEDRRSLGKGQLVWLERPMPHSCDAATGTPLDVDGTVFDPFSARNTPWKLRILDEGPDVMFSVADLDPNDDTVEVIASQFFSKKLSLHSIRIGHNPKVTFRRVIDDRCGAAFSSVLADLDGYSTLEHTFVQKPIVVDSGSTVVSLGNGDPFSHLLVTSHECSVGQETETSNYSSEVMVGEDSNVTAADATTSLHDQSKIDGGSLFAYRVPAGKDSWKTQQWKRSVIATGFKVHGQLSNMINPGAPGFCYTFFPTREGDDCKHRRKWSRPLIGLSGDCAESAYILRPIENTNSLPEKTENVGEDKSTKYALMCEIKCQSTVGSLAVGYDNFYSEVAEQQSGYAKIYVPCYEQDKVLVFSLGSGEDEDVVDDW